MRIEAAISVNAGILHEARVVSMREHTIQKLPSHLAEFLFTLRVPEQVLAVLADGYIGVHAASIHAHHWLGQERCSQPQVGGNLAADQLIQLNLIGSRSYLAVGVVDLKLRWRNFRVVLLVLESHRALHLGGGIDEQAQRVSRQRMKVAAGVYIFELVRLVVVPLSVFAG